MEIRLACDSTEAAEFAHWLLAHGHSVIIGNDTHHHIDGIDTSTDEEYNEIMRALWDEYCKS